MKHSSRDFWEEILKSWKKSHRTDCGVGGIATIGRLLILLLLQEEGVRAGETMGDLCHSVDQVVKLGSNEVEQLVEIDMREVREVLAKLETLAITALDNNRMYMSDSGCEIRRERISLASALQLRQQLRCLRTEDRWWKGGCDLGGNQFRMGNCDEVEEWVKVKGFTWEVGECLEIRENVVLTGCTSQCSYDFRRLCEKAREV